MEDRHLPLFITEEIFVIPEAGKPLGILSAKVATQDEPQKSVESPPAVPSTPTQAPKVEEKILAHYPFAVISESIDNNQKELLAKILQAVGQDLANTPLMIAPDSLDFTYDKLLVFGSFHLDHFPSELYQIAGKEGQVVKAKGLNSIASSTEEKTRLWTVLKQWFKLAR